MTYSKHTFDALSISNNKYKNIEFLGEGSQATVYVAHARKTNQKVAIKIFDENNFTCLREVRILKHMQKLNLKHSLKYIESFTEKGMLLVATEFVKGIELHDYALDGRIASTTELHAIFRRILIAANELHENNICHLDFKLENIIINPKSGEIKVIDFGFAEILGEGKNIDKFRGSMHYSAPEIITNTPYDGKKADIWSLGVLFYLLVCHQFPFPGLNETETADGVPSKEDMDEVAKQILTNDYSFTEQFSAQEKQMIIAMLNPDAHRRPSAKFLLQHLLPL